MRYESMTKERTNISIDNEVLEIAKKQIPNLSNFVEECLKNYLGIGEHLIPVYKQQELNKTIAKCQLELFLMNEKSKIENREEKLREHEINQAWRPLWAEYRETRKYTPAKFDNAVKVLDVSADELEDILDVLFVEKYDTKVEPMNWFEVYKEYGYGDD